MIDSERTVAAAPDPATRGRRRRHRTGDRLQSALGWTALLLILASALRNGGEPPLIATLLCLATLVLFAVQVALDFRHGVPGPAQKAYWLALPFGAVIGWLVLQGAGGLAPGLTHPLWDLAPPGAVPAISAHPDAGRMVALRLGCYALLFMIALRAGVSARGGGIAFIKALALFSTALALYGLIANATGINPLLGEGGSEASVRASFANRNAYATFAVFGVLANVTAYLRSLSGVRHGAGQAALRDMLEAFFAGGWIYALGALIGLVAVTLTGSRAGALAGIIGLFVLFIALQRGRGLAALLRLAVPLALLSFVVLFLSSGIVSSFEGAAEDARLAIYRQVLVGIADRPWLGHGAGAFGEAFRTYVPPEQAGFDWNLAHNSYLENAFEFGLPAAFLFYAVLGTVGVRLIVGLPTRRRNRSIVGFSLACLAAAGFHAGLDFSLQFPANAALLAFILGLGWSQSFPSRHAGDRPPGAQFS